MGCDEAWVAKATHRLISIHAPAWGATVTPIARLAQALFQSTHPHGVRPLPEGYWPKDGFISIHAPAWGATVRVRRLFVSKCISIHAPAWGATKRYAHTDVEAVNFNPRTRMGCDSLLRSTLGETSNFNPRTRMGCDPLDEDAAKEWADFNPRTRMGCDCIIVQNGRWQGPFQSTHPHGVRPGFHLRIQMQAQHFNPRTRMGCDCRRRCLQAAPT